MPMGAFPLFPISLTFAGNLVEIQPYCMRAGRSIFRSPSSLVSKRCWSIGQSAPPPNEKCLRISIRSSPLNAKLLQIFSSIPTLLRICKLISSYVSTFVRYARLEQEWVSYPSQQNFWLKIHKIFNFYPQICAYLSS